MSAAEEDQDAQEYGREFLINDGDSQAVEDSLELANSELEGRHVPVTQKASFERLHPSRAGFYFALGVQLQGGGVQDQMSLASISKGQLEQDQTRLASNEAREGLALEQADLRTSDELHEGKHRPSLTDEDPESDCGVLESRPTPTSAPSVASANSACSTSAEDDKNDEATQLEPAHGAWPSDGTLGAATFEQEDILDTFAGSSKVADVPAMDRGDHPSNGSVAHMTGNCSPCSFKATKKGCSKGEDCAACHYSHPEVIRRPKPCKWKREKYKIFEERAVAMIEADPQSFDLNELDVPPWIQRDDRMHSRLMKVLAQTLDKVEGQHSGSWLPEEHSGSSRPRQFISLTRLSF